MVATIYQEEQLRAGMVEQQGRPSEEQEKLLLIGCRKGDQACWERLYVSHRQAVARALFRVLGPTDELEDLVQTVFLRVYKGLDRFEGRSRFLTWVCGISTYVAMEYIRKRKKNREFPDELAGERLVDPGPDPSRQLVSKQELGLLQREMEKLSVKKRNVLMMHDFMQIPTDEIAFMMDVPQATVRTRLFHARNEMARKMARHTTGVSA